MQVEPAQPGQTVQRARQDLNQVVVGQIHTLQIVRHICGDCPKPIVTQVERVKTWQGVVDEDHPFQLVGRQIQNPQVPVVGGVILFKGSELVPCCADVPKGPRQGGGQAAHLIVGHIQGTKVGIVA